MVCVQATRLGERVQLVDSDKEGGLGAGIVAIIVVMLLVPLVGLAVALLLWARRRMRMAADDGAGAGSSSAVKAGPVQAEDFSFHTPPSGATLPAQEEYPDVQQFGDARSR